MLIVALLGYGWMAYAQSPAKINFQTVVRDNMGVALAKQSLSLRLTITNSPTPPYKTYYQEVHSGLSTDNFGLLNVHIGTGTPDLLNYSPFNTVNWPEGGFFLVTEVNTGNGYVTLGASQFVSVPNAFHSNTADSVLEVTLQELKDVDIDNPNDGEVLAYNQSKGKWEPKVSLGNIWNLNGSKVYYSADNVGIGTSNPLVGLTLGSSKEFAFATSFNPPTQRDLLSLYGTSNFEQDDFVGFGYETRSFLNAQNQLVKERVLYHKSDGGHRWYVNHNADAGASAVMNLDGESVLTLEPVGNSSADGSKIILNRGDGTAGIEIDAGGAFSMGIMSLDRIDLQTADNAVDLVSIRRSGAVSGQIEMKDGANKSLILLTSNGTAGGSLTMKRISDGKETVELLGDKNGKSRLSIDEIEIKGGADFAERFDVALRNSEEILPGMVVSIDPDHMGGLTPSQQAYDRKVAGIISGGGGIRPGMVMGQEGTLADGEFPVALSGRVYVYADESKGTIEPGDLLTSADRPGFAMKVKNHKAAQGAIIGKAMGKVNPETGMVLILVSLQ